MSDTRLPYLLRISPVYIIFGALFVVIIPLLIWANFAEIEQRSTTRGIVIASDKTQKIQSPIDGVVDIIMVKEGEKVKQGDLLVVLEKEQNQAALDAAASKVASLQAKLIRLKAEILGENLNYPDDFLKKDYQEFVTTQKNLFVFRKKALEDEISSLESALKLKEEELFSNQKLVDSGDIGRNKILSIDREIVDLRGKISNIKNRFYQSAQEEKTSTEEELSIRKEMFTEKRVTLDRSEILSQMDAAVKEIIITTRGAKVRPGDVILELVPLGQDLIIEAKLKPTDISFIKVGQEARVKLDTYDFSIYGSFTGRVEYISPDTIIEKNARGEEYFFKVLISLDNSDLMTKKGTSIDITTGMGAQADIITGSRTVLHYIAKPVIKVLDESFTER
ncbi:MAG: HlyD family efflux transporter periplasmic adaptor subunit [Gammaproteobacteria bacterium]|nr:HlyD family efflux transporter periplasmic adaptor subunit [Gammaproteobacteria bacterium]